MEFEKYLEEIIEGIDQIFSSPEGEQLLLKFYKIKAQVEEAERRIKQKIEETALRHSPHFKSLTGEKLTHPLPIHGKQIHAR